MLLLSVVPGCGGKLTGKSSSGEGRGHDRMKYGDRLIIFRVFQSGNTFRIIDGEFVVGGIVINHNFPLLFYVL